MSTQYIARWYHVKQIATFGERGERTESSARECFVMADNPGHAEQLIKQMDRSATIVRLETCSAYKGP